ncbi:MAG: hypothetical protein Tp156SUR915002_48 [Prokaryotic dsDNA virus sp.]|jgi:hypothetical protein|nr:MAG: hypothetical protein Tp162SUR384061_2 [Prokaryotic dsDNA virus sp.]QDP59787.1 MAG: hypothetical protein Tp156SUR915002_48 [Prokaryotic dsDNA virus sp.]|tara:strand:- start:1307 stop:2572 length:1266 start_codon:yes stop_codon:yes gene_type:complete
MSVAFDTNVTLTVEIAFDSNPLDTSPSFTDISAFVRSFDIKRGRNNELGQFPAGQCTILLSNADNRFNPTNTSSPYYDSSAGKTKIQPLKRLRVKAVYDSTNYTLFEGYLDTIPVQYPDNGSDSTVQISATDAFRLFQQSTIQGRGFRVGLSGFSEVGLSTRLGMTFTNELSSARVTKILDAFGFPSDRRDVQTGTLQVGTQSITDNVLTALQECETAENAQFFISSDGKATFRNRDYRLSNTKAINVQATFSNDGSNLPYVDVGLSFDDQEIVNIYEWTREGGTTQYIADTDSVLNYGAFDNTTTTINISDTDVASLISQKVAETSQPIVRFNNLVVNPRENTLLWTQALGRDFGDRIKVKVVNPDGSSLEDELLIESIQHSVTASSQSWRWSATLSPAGSSAWILGQAKLGEGTRFAYA